MRTINLQKSSFWILVTSILISMSNCDFCKDCDGNYLQPILDRLPYQNNQEVEYSNNNLIDIHTVKIDYNEPSDQYDCGKENPSDCAGSLKISIGWLAINYYQGGYYMQGLYGPNCSSDEGFFNINDTIDYMYKGQTIKVQYFLIDTLSIIDDDQAYFETLNLSGNYYYDFYLSFDNRLLKYTKKNKGVFEQWIVRD